MYVNIVWWTKNKNKNKINIQKTGKACEGVPIQILDDDADLSARKVRCSPLLLWAFASAMTTLQQNGDAQK